jgi:hypothetical protein
MSTQKVLEFRSATKSQEQFQAQPSPQAILSVGRNMGILRRRERVIAAQSGLPVQSMTPEEANKWTRSEEPHLWIFCSTIELSMLVHLACAVRRYSPRSRLLLMEGKRPPGFEAALFHWAIKPLEGPEILLDAVTHLSVAG